jgi:hypothetical protein
MDNAYHDYWEKRAKKFEGTLKTIKEILLEDPDQPNEQLYWIEVAIKQALEDR